MLATTQLARCVLAACLGIALDACQSAGPSATAPLLKAEQAANGPVASPEEPDAPQIDVDVRTAIERMAAFSRRSRNPQDMVTLDKKAVGAMLGVDLAELPPVHGELKRRFVAPPMDWTPPNYKEHKEGGSLVLDLVGPWKGDPGLLAVYKMPIDPERQCIPLSWLKKHLAVELRRMRIVPIPNMVSRLPRGSDSQQATPSAPEVEDGLGGVFFTLNPYHLFFYVSDLGCTVNFEAQTFFKTTQH